MFSWQQPRFRTFLCGVVVAVCYMLVAVVPAVAQGSLADARAIIAARQAELGAAAGMIVLDKPTRLDGDVTLAPGHGLRIAAPLSVGRSTVHLAGHNEVRCEADISVDNATELFVADAATDVSVRGCDVTVKGQPGGTLLTATRAVRVVEAGNHVINLALFNTHNGGGAASQTTDVSITDNSTELHGARPIGVYLLYVLRGVVANNRFMGTGHGVQWWGGDGNLGWHGAAEVKYAGFLSITGNECYDAGGACVWGSMGENVTVTGNTAEGCGDVCFDTEGGVRNLFSGNVARGCASGCYSVQMESEDVVFSSNFAYADTKYPTAALFLIKHHNENPAPHANLTVTGNTLSCGTLCMAFYTEGEAGLDLSHNTLVNGLIHFANYTGEVRVSGNSLRFTVPLGEPAISGPSLAGANTSFIENNTLMDQAAPNPKSVCIAQGWSDYNSTDEMRITDNTCVGFGIGIATETAGQNPGAPRATWVIGGNRFSRVPESQQIVHRKTSGNETYLAQPVAAP